MRGGPSIIGFALGVCAFALAYRALKTLDQATDDLAQDFGLDHFLPTDARFSFRGIGNSPALHGSPEGGDFLHMWLGRDAHLHDGGLANVWQ